MPQAPTKRHRAPRGEGDKLRTQILDAAEALLVEAGSDEAVSVRAIAEAVGVTPPSIYRHFEDKEELLYQMCQRRFAEFNAAMESAEPPDDPVQRLRALGVAYARFALDHPEHYRLLMMTVRETRFDKGESEGPRAFDRLVAAVQRCIDAGLCRSDDAVVTAVALWAGVHGLCSLLITARNFPWPAPADRLVQELLDIQLEGIVAADRS